MKRFENKNTPILICINTAEKGVNFQDMAHVI